MSMNTSSQVKHDSVINCLICLGLMMRMSRTAEENGKFTDNLCLDLMLYTIFELVILFHGKDYHLHYLLSNDLYFE